MECFYAFMECNGRPQRLAGMSASPPRATDHGVVIVAAAVRP